MTTSQQVEASTVDAATLFGNNRFIVPDFQRDYSWRSDAEVNDFWLDLEKAIDEGDDYFLGLLVTTDTSDRREIVDGQQRLITLSLLANALRLVALAHDRQLVAETLRTTFLFSIDYRTEKQVQRLELTSESDRKAFWHVIAAATKELLPSEIDSHIVANQQYLLEHLSADIISAHSRELRIGQWAEFITRRLRFAIFDHPDRAAAFRVYEVINTRGKNLTPAELIKSYVIGTSDNREVAYTRWNSIEHQFDELSAGDQLTTFVRHVVALRRGYVIPRELYTVVTKTYFGGAGVTNLLEDLEHHLSVYQQLVDPTADVEASEERVRAFSILANLSAARFRPIVLAAADSSDPANLTSLLEIIVPGLIGGGFGTGSIEAQFARAARRIHKGEAEWADVLGDLRRLLPSRAEFEIRLQRGIPKTQAHILRSALIQSTKVPELIGHPHQVRPRNAEDWDGFSNNEYRNLGTTLANWILVETDRRPQGSHTPATVKSKLIPAAVSGELVTLDEIDDWTANFVEARNAELGKRCGDLWYGA